MHEVRPDAPKKIERMMTEARPTYTLCYTADQANVDDWFMATTFASCDTCRYRTPVDKGWTVIAEIAAHIFSQHEDH